MELENNKVLLIGGDAEKIEIYDLNNDTSETIDIGLKTNSYNYNTKAYIKRRQL